MVAYFFSTLSRNNTLDKDVSYSLSKACDEYSKFVQRLWMQSDIKIATMWERLGQPTIDIFSVLIGSAMSDCMLY